MRGCAVGRVPGVMQSGLRCCGPTSRRWGRVGADLGLSGDVLVADRLWKADGATLHPAGRLIGTPGRSPDRSSCWTTGRDTCRSAHRSHDAGHLVQRGTSLPRHSKRGRSNTESLLKETAPAPFHSAAVEFAQMRRYGPISNVVEKSSRCSRTGRPKISQSVSLISRSSAHYGARVSTDRDVGRDRDRQGDRLVGGSLRAEVDY
jgi:hypothetical protein